MQTQPCELCITNHSRTGTGMGWMLKMKALPNTRNSLFGSVNEASQLPKVKRVDTRILKKHGNSSET